MPSYIDVTNGLRDTYTRVLPVGEGVCNVCHGQPGDGFDTCYSCNQTLWQVAQPCRLVVPISYAEPGSVFHQSMWKYKAEDYPAATRARYSRELSCLLYRFLTEHRRCIAEAAGADWDVVTIVPSSGARRDPHPLEGVVTAPPALAAEFAPLLRRGRGTVGHNEASDTAYEVTEYVADKRVLVIDDTFTSGARSQSAASALSLAGAHVIAIVPIERHVKPGYSQHLLDVARQQPFEFGRCCLEAAGG